MRTTLRITGEERALARSSLYRLLSLMFSYPDREVVSSLAPATEVAKVGAQVLGSSVEAAVSSLAAELALTSPQALESQYQKLFTLTFSAECPLYETAFSASHLFQQTQHQADIAGFYRAFGVVGSGERPDHLATELEFAYLLALKEARARQKGDQEHLAVTRAAARSFMRDHLARWGRLIAGRIAMVGPDTVYERAARLLAAFLDWDERFLRLGRIAPYRDEPVIIADEPEDLTCPLEGPFLEMMGALGSGGEHVPQ